MYLLNKNKKRKFAPVNRRYARKVKFKRIALFLTLLVLAECTLLLWREGKNYWDNLKLPPYLAWSIKTITVTAPSKNLKEEIDNQLAVKRIKENKGK